MNNATIPPVQPPPMTIAALIDNLWRLHAQNIASGTQYDIEIPNGIVNIIGEDGVAIMATRFRYLIQAPVTTYEDSDRGLMKITPSRNPTGHETIMPEVQKHKAKTSKQAKIARPPNAFILYRQHHHPLVKTQQPGLHNNQISVILGTQWKNEAENIKARFISLAKQLKIKHFQEHPGYQYQPRKPSEKRRRMTRRKAAALANAASTSSAIIISTETNDASATNQITSSLSELPRTLGGNVELELGDENVDDDTLAAMLDQYNNSLPPPTVGSYIAQQTPPVIYDEPTEEAQNDGNFYSSMHDFNPFMTDEELASELNMWEVGAVDTDALMAQFDQQQEFNFDAELRRMSG